MHSMSLNEALAVVKAAGYRVSKPRARLERPKLNAIGRPFSAQYDPNYRMKYRAPSAAYATSTAGLRHAATVYRGIMQRKYADDATMLKTVLERQGIAR